MLKEERMGGNIANIVLAANVDWAKEKIQKEFLKQNLDDLIKMIEGLGIPCGKIGPTEKWLDHAQVKAIGMRAEVKDPKRGDVAMPGIPINLTKTPGSVHGPAPEAGADTGKIKVRPAPPRPEKTPVLRPGPLAGYRILDMGTFVAGPYCGSLLAELGADVIKVEPLTGDPFRATGFTYNRGMRSVGMDLQNKDGRDAFYEMVKISDVVIDSLRPGVTKKLGIDFEKLNSLKNGMVTVSMSAYGEGGPLSHLPGVDMVLQAMSGMMTSQAGDDDPVANTIAIIDVSTAAMCALAGILGIYHREKTGEGQRIWNSLAATATYLQSEELVRYQGRPALVKGSENHRGPNWLDRFYKTKDGWIRLQAAHARQGVEGDAGEGRHQAQRRQRQGAGDGRSARAARERRCHPAARRRRHRRRPHAPRVGGDARSGVAEGRVRAHSRGGRRHLLCSARPLCDLQPDAAFGPDARVRHRRACGRSADERGAASRRRFRRWASRAPSPSASRCRSS